MRTKLKVNIKACCQWLIRVAMVTSNLPLIKTGRKAE